MILNTRDISERFASEIGLYKELAALLCERGEQIDSLNSLASCGDAAQIAYIAHKLKGAAGILGALKLAETAGELEETARKQMDADYELISEQIRNLSQVYRETCAAMQAFIEEREKSS